ncbi:MAG: permease-like cell division protein FtsX [Chloroherpetonaceae bacterium]|nr:permease-like cell division protein FtsX [Chloroherpetonaceae bacterium]MDW8437149.1 permease-like cell division protein FtsX [Chloroherpetonaceae bacterium]
MNLRYILSESVSGFRRAKLASAISVATIGVSLVLFGAFATLALNASRVLSEIRSRVEVEFFLSESLKEKDARALAASLRNETPVQTAIYVSRDSAAQIFKAEFGEDIVSILGSNPLPPSIKVRLKSDYATLDSLERFVASVKGREGVVEARYNREFLAGLDRNARVLFFVAVGVGLLLSLASIALVSNAIRLIIMNKQEIVRTMFLVGATQSFIRAPFLIEGALQGFLGGLLAIGLLAALNVSVYQIRPDIYEAIALPDYRVYALLAALGFLLGLLGSAIATRKFLSQ